MMDKDKSGRLVGDHNRNLLQQLPPNSTVFTIAWTEDGNQMLIQARMQSSSLGPEVPTDVLAERYYRASEILFEQSLHVLSESWKANKPDWMGHGD